MQDTAAIGVLGRAEATDRVAGFDLLRGVCAIAVLCYHVLSWTNIAHLYNWGTYTVYIFFVLSGASMYVAYARRFENGYSVPKFLAMRLVRLMPLFVAVLLVGVLIRLRKEGVNAATFEHAFLSLFFQFGLGNPGVTGHLVQGGWSLGIEFMFYLLFPAILALVSGRYWLPVLVLAFASQHVFIASTLGGGRTLVANWPAYTQFLSFCFYFVAGCAIGRALEAGWLRHHWIAAPVLVGSMGVLAATSGDASGQSLVGFTGVGLSLLAAIAVTAAAVVRAPAWISEKLGGASYGVYLLHPLVFDVARTATKRLGGGDIGALLLTLAVAVAIALVLERWYEKPIQRFFKQRSASRPAHA